MFKSKCWFVAIVALAAVAPNTMAQKVPPEVQKSVDAVRNHIDGLPNGKGAGEVTAQTAAAVKQIFPEHHMVIVRFRLFPVARVMPEGLSASNIYAVNKEGKFEHLKNVKTLEKFFRTHHQAVKNEKDAKRILAALSRSSPPPLLVSRQPRFLAIASITSVLVRPSTTSP